MPGCEFVDIAIDCLGVGNVAEGEIVLDRLGIEPTGQRRVLQQRLQLGAEEERPVGQKAVIERLDAEA